MIGKIIQGRAIVVSKTERMRREFTFPVTHYSKTHNLVITLNYDEEDDSFFNRKLTSFEVDVQPIQSTWAEEHQDYLEDLNECIGEWFDSTFPEVDDVIANKECEQLFEIMWGIISEENLE